MSTTWKLAIAVTVTLTLAACAPVAESAEDITSKKTFRITTADRKTIRQIPTTQVEIRLDEWPDQTFLLWTPEYVAPLGGNWEPDFTQQKFSKTPRGGLRWKYPGAKAASIIAEIIPRADSLLLEVRVKNKSDEDLKNVAVQNCFHLSAAANFACDDFSRIHLRTGGTWKSLKQLSPTVDMPMFYREQFLEKGRVDSWGGRFRKYNQKARVDHPLMICTSRDGKQAVATASQDYQCVFHNQLPYLRCIHSQQAPRALLRPGHEAVFRQVIYFVDGSVAECEAAYNKDVKDGRFQPAAD